MLYHVSSAYSLSLLMLWTVTVLHLCSVYSVVGALHDDEMVMMMMMMMIVRYAEFTPRPVNQAGLRAKKLAGE